MMPNVQELVTAVDDAAVDVLHADELYLFELEGSGDEPSICLWAIYARQDHEAWYVETATRDFRHFVHWKRLSSKWRCLRKATSEEYRDYFYALALFEVGEHNR